MGDKTEEVIINMTQTIIKANKKGAGFFMPPRIVDEFLSFFENKEQSFLKKYLSTVTIKSPDVRKTNLGGEVFYRLIEDIRRRSYRGLAVAEEEIIRAGRLMMGKVGLNKVEFEKTIGSVVKTFRDRYRQATRFGFLDSLADLDLIMLACDLNGFLVSSDVGVIKWGRVFGVKEMPVSVFAARLSSF